MTKINIKQFKANKYSGKNPQKKYYIGRIQNGLVQHFFDNKLINETVYIN